MRLLSRVPRPPVLPPQAAGQLRTHRPGYKPAACPLGLSQGQTCSDWMGCSLADLNTSHSRSTPLSHLTAVLPPSPLSGRTQTRGWGKEAAHWAWVRPWSPGRMLSPPGRHQGTGKFGRRVAEGRSAHSPCSLDSGRRVRRPWRQEWGPGRPPYSQAPVPPTS